VCGQPLAAGGAKGGGAEEEEGVSVEKKGRME
jgi:hypothetical protein